MASSKRNIFCPRCPLWWNPTVTVGFHSRSLVTRSFDVFFSLMCAWSNGSANSRYTGALRRHGAHCVVTLKLTCTHQVDLSYLQMVPSRHRRWCQQSLCLYRWNIEDWRSRLKIKMSFIMKAHMILNDRVQITRLCNHLMNYSEPYQGFSFTLISRHSPIKILEVMKIPKLQDNFCI